MHTIFIAVLIAWPKTILWSEWLIATWLFGFKAIVSWDWEGLKMVPVDRYEVASIAGARVYMFLTLFSWWTFKFSCRGGISFWVLLCNWAVTTADHFFKLYHTFRSLILLTARATLHLPLDSSFRQYHTTRRSLSGEFSAVISAYLPLKEICGK